MNDLERVAAYLEAAEEGAYIENAETGVYVEVVNMCGGRYLVCNKDGDVIRQTGNEAIAYKYLM